MPKNNAWRWAMYPELHDRVSALLEEDGLHFKFYNVDDDTCHIEAYDTNIMGLFTCNQKNCRTKRWSSKKVSITIRMYSEDRYNARVYSQHCKACNSCSRPMLDEKSYVDRVVYRIKKWKGVDVTPPHYSKDAKGGHESALCEGCRAGHCLEG